MPSPRPSPSRPPSRRAPVQERAQRTIEVIFQATAQVLADAGEAGLTTNRVAERAGVSIGTLYQYFPNKQALLAAMIEAERKRAVLRFEALLQRALADGDSTGTIVHAVVSLAVRSFGGGNLAQRRIASLAWRLDQDDLATRALKDASDRIAARVQLCVDTRGCEPVPYERIYVALRALLGAIRFASLEESPLLEGRTLERELCRMCIAVMWPGTQTPASAQTQPTTR